MITALFTEAERTPVLEVVIDVVIVMVELSVGGGVGVEVGVEGVEEKGRMG